MTFASIVSRIESYVFQPLVGLAIAVGLVMFLYGVLKYITAGGEGKAKEGVQMMGFGIIVLFVMVAVWGLVAIVGSTLGVNY